MEGSAGGGALPTSVNAAAAATLSSSSCLLGTRMISHPFNSSKLPFVGKCVPSTGSKNAASSGNARRHRLSRPLRSKAVQFSSLSTRIGNQTATRFVLMSQGEIHSCNDRFSSKTSRSALPIIRTEIRAQESEELGGAASPRTLLMPSKRMDASRFLNSGPKGSMAWLGQSFFRRQEDEKAEYEKARQFVEKVAEAERKRIEEDQEWERQAAIQAEREFMQIRAWQTFLLKLQGKLRGTAWDPESGPSIPFSKFWKLLEAKKVNFLDYADFGEHVAVILPYYKDKEQTSEEGSKNVQTDKQVPGDAAKSSERDIIFKRHVVQRMPVDNWTDIWRRLHQQLLNVEISNSNSLPRQIYPTFETTAVWGMRLLLAVVIFLWVDKKLSPFYRIRNPDDRWQRKRPKLDTVNMELGSLGQSRARFISAEESTGVTFEDFAGQEYVKRELQEVVKILKQSKEFEDLGVYCPKGVLLYGPPGTGKTLLAKAIAGEAGVPFFSASGSEFVEMFVGVAAARVRDLFTRARQFAPSIVFIDEIDAIGAKRGGPDVGGGGVEREQGLIQILTELDGFQSIDSQVVVVGATNRLDMLDPALLRKGRFDKTISIGLPTEEGRLAILKVHARNKAFNSEQEKETLLKELAALTYEFSGAELQNILNEAAILAARKDKDTIEREELFEALRRQQGTFTTGEEDVLDVTGEAKVRLAYREASIAVLECYFPNPHRPFTKTNIRDMDTYPNMEYDEPRHRVFARKKDIVDSIVRACARCLHNCRRGFD